MLKLITKLKFRLFQIKEFVPKKNVFQIRKRLAQKEKKDNYLINLRGTLSMEQYVLRRVKKQQNKQKLSFNDM